MEIDQITNGHDNLVVLETILSSKTSAQKAKWAVICLSDAFYSFGISCLMHSDGTSNISTYRGERYTDYEDIIYTKDEMTYHISQSKRLEHIHPSYFELSWERISKEEAQKRSKEEAQKRSEKQTRNKQPDNLIGFWTVLALVQSKECFMKKYGRSSSINLTSEQKHALAQFRDWRNEFIHYKPKVLIIEDELIYREAIQHIDPIKQLLHSHNITPTFLSQNIKEPDELLDRIELKLKQLENDSSFPT